MATATDLLVDVLIDLVRSVADQPRRILFKGVSDLSGGFRERVADDHPDWRVAVTGQDTDIIGARNDVTIATLVVFYRTEVQERESLNAFRQFDEDAIAEALVRAAEMPDRLPDAYTSSELVLLRLLLSLVYPSAEQLAAFLLDGKELVGTALPRLGLYTDPELTYALPERQWLARVQDNHAAAVMRWRELLDKVHRSREARRQLGDEVVALLRQAEADPAAKQFALQGLTLSRVLRALNPPTRVVEALIREGLRQEEAETLVANVKAGTIDPRDLTGLSGAMVRTLLTLVPSDDSDDGVNPAVETLRVKSCLEGLLHLARLSPSLPARLTIARDDVDNDGVAELQLADSGQWEASLSAHSARLLSVPVSGATELRFRVCAPEAPAQSLIQFTIENQAKRLEPYAEMWPSAEQWVSAITIDAQHESSWRMLQACVGELRDIVDPDWQVDQATGDAEPEREPNNPIYMLFDLVYLAHRDLFERFLDAWLVVASLPWRAAVATNQAEWRIAMGWVLQLGLAAGQTGDALAVLPFHPLRLTWHRAIIAQVERWLDRATQHSAPLVFEPAVLQAQLQPVDRPRALIHRGQRLVEASNAHFFSLFDRDDRQRRARAPLDRAGVKVEQFGRMWPFSMTRLHLAFQPGDAGDAVYHLLERMAGQDEGTAFRVQALLDQPGIVTAFDRSLLTTGDDTTDLLTREHHEGLLPRVDYVKGALDDTDSQTTVATHVALLVDAFREERFGFESVVGWLNPHPHWEHFGRLVASADPAALAALKKVDIAAPAYHAGSVNDDQRDLVYVPFSGDEPEYLRLLVDTLTAWQLRKAFTSSAAYFERVHWDQKTLEALHLRSDWVILLDRTLDKHLFARLAPAGVRLIDFYPSLPGGYRMSVSSRRTDTVEWQLVQVLHQAFGGSLDLRSVAHDMIETLTGFASGLLLKTLGGGSLAQELLGLYATYRALIADGVFEPDRDWLIPLDNYQDWFGRRTERGRRADLLVLRTRAPMVLEMLAVESKWYKQAVGAGFVADEFGPTGQMFTAVRSLQSLFSPEQDRLDRDYWQRTLRALLDEAPVKWPDLRPALDGTGWTLRVDGIVYVHQYGELDASVIRKREADLRTLVATAVAGSDASCYALGNDFSRLHLTSYPDLVALYDGTDRVEPVMTTEGAGETLA